MKNNPYDFSLYIILSNSIISIFAGMGNSFSKNIGNKFKNLSIINILGATLRRIIIVIITNRRHKLTEGTREKKEKDEITDECESVYV